MRGLVGLLAAVVLVAGVPAAAAGEAHSVWIWSSPDSVDVDAIAAEGFNQIYLWAPDGHSNDPSFDAVIGRAHAAGLEILAVGGDPAWASAPSAWRSWAREVDGGNWDGAVINVEPYLHPEWNSNRNGLISQYLRGMRNAQRELTVPMLPTVPFWFDTIPQRRSTLLDEVAKRADGIVVLAYRDHAEGIDGILDLTTEEIAAGEDRRIPVVITVETAPVEPPKVTFHEEGRAVLDQELSVVRAALAGSAAFAGTSIHYWDTFLALGP